MSAVPGELTPITPPLWLVAELTYTCPLHCPFCSNPLDFAAQTNELSTADWIRVLREARALGAVQLGLSGGEPLTRKDLEELVAEAHALGYYTNLITSGAGLNEVRIRRLKESGLDHIQLSFQDSTREVNDFLSSTRTFDLKRRVAALIKDHGFPMVMNCVIHRLNIDHVDRIIDLAVEIGAEYLELANTQYYGWALLNRDHLIPSRAQLERAEAVVAARRADLDNRLRILFVVPDYFEGRPKRCMNGWGTTILCVSPDGTALPCQAARMLPNLEFPSVRTSSVRDIWYESRAFNRFRGEAWMPEPCRSCPERTKDLGGCRCQAYLLTGDMGATDPVCDKSPQHGIVLAAIAKGDKVPERALLFRSPENSRVTIEATRPRQS
ncbi:MAG: pyrroloquinoline quinone biosynthesis protein PqqE [Steroidobacteraceae bacterium]|jgi:pyrroloquinoline quinone biosynthesis protein E